MFRTAFPFTLIFLLAIVGAPAAAQEIKVCAVDLQAALASVNEGRQALEQLTGELQRRQAEINTQQQDLEAWMEQTQMQMAALSPEQREARLAEYEQRVTALQAAYQAHQEDLGRAEFEATQRIADRMITIVEELAATRQCTYVLQASALLYGPTAADLTEELIEIYNSRF